MNHLKFLHKLIAEVKSRDDHFSIVSVRSELDSDCILSLGAIVYLHLGRIVLHRFLLHRTPSTGRPIHSTCSPIELLASI